MRQFWNRIPGVFKNFYVLATILLFAWMLLADQNDLISQYELYKKQHDLETQREYYQSKIQEVTKDRDELLSNDKKLEKFAREKYYMKRDNEDVYVVVD